MDNKISFWEYLKQNKVLIPIIQRDYAQGRPDKGSLRKSFLSSLRQAIDDNIKDPSNVLKLDFVYGSVEDNNMLPLDGQQRLTTLWLLHWFVALKAGKLAEAESILKRFSYETRISSREFCAELCSAENFKSLAADESLYRYITTRTWFSYSWLHDPSVTSMLRMISGTYIDVENIDKKDKKRQLEAKELNALKDGLEKIFKEATDEQFKEYWQALVSENPPFYFYQLPLHEFGLSDDLYVKMNARGKQLTPYENFKADLIGYIRRQAKKQNDAIDIQPQHSEEDWNSLLDPRDGIPIKLDTVWADIFWKHKSRNNVVDEIFFSFINRVFWDELVGYNLKQNRSVEFLENDESYNYLMADHYVDYHDLAPYKFAEGEIPYSVLKNLKTVLDRFVKLDFPLPRLLRKIGGKEFEFIPKYEYNDKDNQNDDKFNQVKITLLTQPYRVVFHAIYKYFIEGDADVRSLKQWFRVVCNITSGRSMGKDCKREIIRTTGSMIAAFKIVDSLESHSVYTCLADNYVGVSTDADSSEQEIPARLSEEIIKAKQILDEHGYNRVYLQSKDFNTWEEAIIAAENYAFFNGSIWFLFQNAEGKIDWNYFDEKFKRAKEYFRANYNPESVTSCSDASLLQSLLGYFIPDDFERVLWNTKYHIFANDEQSWKYYLYSGKIVNHIHTFLTQPLSVKILTDSNKNWGGHILYLLSNTELLDYAIEKFGNSYIRNYKNHKALYPSGTGIFLNADYRDNFLNNQPVIITGGEKVLNSGLYYGSDIDFTYNNIPFRWHSDNKVYLMKIDNPGDYATQLHDGTEEYISYDTTGKDISDAANLIAWMQCQE